MPDIQGGGSPDKPEEGSAKVATGVFVDHRELLFSVVYNMLGSVADTEDVLQETWLAWVGRNAAASGEQVTSPRAYLVRIAVNAALARQAAISRRREEYVGPWLPEPLLTDGEHRHPIPDLEIRYRRINGEPAVLLMSGRLPRMLVLLDLVPGGERARGVYVVTNPDKLFRLR
jgi:DNA-directed RNA polymerase specialized sigma24 family protein